ncbi:MAG TPA: hypothetical protein VLZ06_06490 [Solirubrobacteraceae bacterium]|nr:hypothetical protein [Solirubrobacteraceae bacterium]
MRAVNLIPVERRVGAGVGMGRSQGGAYALIALVGVLALLVFLYGKASHDISSDTSQAAKLTTEAERERSDAGALARYNGLIAASEARTAAAESLVESRFDWAHSLHEVGRVLPLQVSIASLTGAIGATEEGSKKASSGSAGSSSSSASGSSSSAATSSASSVTSATPPGSVPTVTLAGCADSQSVVAQMLQRLKLIDGVKEATLTSSVSSTTTGGASTTCPAPSPTFAVSVVFEPLPAGVPSSATNVSNPATPAGAPASAGSTP